MTAVYTNTNYKVQKLKSPLDGNNIETPYNWEVVNTVYDTREGLFITLPSAIDFSDTLSDFLVSRPQTTQGTDNVFPIN